MAINITNLINAINAKLSGDSDETFVLSNASKLADDIKNTRKFDSIDRLPEADSSNTGDIIRVGIADSSASYYVSNGYSWKEVVGGGGSPIGVGVYEGPRTLSKSVDSASEGETVSFKLVTSGARDGTVIAYKVTGITDSDISSGSLTGNFTLNNDSAVVSFTLTNDSVVEARETLTLSLLDVHLDSSQSIVIKGDLGYQGLDYGFYAGGNSGSQTSNLTSGSYFPFASDTPASPDSFLTLTDGIWKFSTASSPTHGWSLGGQTRAYAFPTPTFAMYNKYQSFPFASGGSSSNIPNLVNGTIDGTSATDTNNGVGYAVNGRDTDDAPLAPGYLAPSRRRGVIFSSGTVVAYPGYTTGAYGAGCSAPEVGKGFVVGGIVSTPPTVIQYGILSFGFANGAWATHTPEAVPPAVNSPPSVRTGTNPHAQNSGTYGYLAGGFSSVSSIVKFPFSTTVTVSAVGNLTRAAHSVNGLSGNGNGYMLGVPEGPPGGANIQKDKWPFSSDTNASDVGDMNSGRTNFGTYQQ